MKIPLLLGYLLVTSVLWGCDEKQPEQKDEEATTATAPQKSDDTEDDNGSLDFEPVPRRPALPLKMLDMRTDAAEAGTLYDENFPDGVPLSAVGLNQCQTGWVLQGFLRPKPDHDLKATPPFQLAIPTIPEGQTVEETHPTLPGQTMIVNFDQATMHRLAGEFVVVDDESGEDVFRMEIDTKPVSVTPAAGLGPQGCFTTGTWQMKEGTETVEGPTTAVFDGRRVHYIGMRLTEKYGIGMWLILQPQHRQPQYVLRGNLKRIIEEPKKYPFRVVFETREHDPEFGVDIQELQALDGDFRANFQKANPQGPVRIEIDDLKVPEEWEGPVSGTIDQVRVETLIVTDTKGTSVPIPTEAEFE